MPIRLQTMSSTHPAKPIRTRRPVKHADRPTRPPPLAREFGCPHPIGTEHDIHAESQAVMAESSYGRPLDQRPARHLSQ